jgi:hypothetical protein
MDSDGFAGTNPSAIRFLFTSLVNCSGLSHNINQITALKGRSVIDTTTIGVLHTTHGDRRAVRWQSGYDGANG